MEYGENVRTNLHVVAISLTIKDFDTTLTKRNLQSCIHLPFLSKRVYEGDVLIKHIFTIDPLL